MASVSQLHFPPTNTKDACVFLVSLLRTVITQKHRELVDSSAGTGLGFNLQDLETNGDIRRKGRYRDE
ncbi:unnamed protein product [Citrullus colocynthis]|uniref:Uncharacterized protein n=1 Tax=Citrullus colocynthis TaxID=252529 RepID=A0ABP0YAU3_9ROSI